MPTRVFVASNMPTGYPYKLQKPNVVSDRVRDTAETFIMDSGIGDDVTNAEVLDLAHQYDADYVVAKDYLHDQQATTESVRDFLDQHADHATDATPMIPLQPPHHEHYPDLPDHSHYVLGGMVDREIGTHERVCWIEKFARVAPDDCHIHALGVGGGWGIVQAFAGSGILDSVDCSTPEQAAMNGSILTERLKHDDAMAFPGGEGRCKRTYPLAEFNSWQVRDVWRNEARARRERETAAWA